MACCCTKNPDMSCACNEQNTLHAIKDLLDELYTPTPVPIYPGWDTKALQSLEYRMAELEAAQRVLEAGHNALVLKIDEIEKRLAHVEDVVFSQNGFTELVAEPLRPTFDLYTELLKMQLGRLADNLAPVDARSISIAIDYVNNACQNATCANTGCAEDEARSSAKHFR